MPVPSPDSAQIALTLSALIALWVGWVKALRPRWRRFREVLDGLVDTFIGRRAFTDQATGRLVPEVPALGTRIGSIEQTLAVVADQQRLLENHEQRLTALEDHRVRDIVTSAERAATAAASAEMLKLVSERDTVDGDATEPSGEL